jgi:hypothetical protein
MWFKKYLFIKKIKIKTSKMTLELLKDRQFKYYTQVLNLKDV